MTIRPSVGKSVWFNVWHDIERLEKVYTESGDGVDRPSNLNEWTGEVVSIDERFHKKESIGSRDNHLFKGVIKTWIIHY